MRLQRKKETGGMARSVVDGAHPRRYVSKLIFVTDALELPIHGRIEKTGLLVVLGPSYLRAELYDSIREVNGQFVYGVLDLAERRRGIPDRKNLRPRIAALHFRDGK